MKLLLLASCLLISQASIIRKPDQRDCTGITINEAFYDKEILKEGLERPYLLAVDRSNDILYFSYSLSTNDDHFKSAHIDLKTKQFENIDSIVNGFAQTVDQKNHEVYIGSSDGIYKYDYTKRSSLFLTQKGKDIWNVYFNDILYFSEFPSEFMYTYQDGRVSRFKELEDTKADHMIIDNDGDIIFSNATGLYTQKKGTKDAVYFPLSEYVRGLTTDINGVPYVVRYNGISIVDKESRTLKKVLDLEDPFGVTFDSSNNMIYSERKILIRLKANKNNNCSQ